jgi:hypothetical protein
MEQLESNVVKPQVSFVENDQEIRAIDLNVEENLDNKINDIKRHITEKNGKGQSDGIKDELYLEAQRLWREFATTLKESKYNFYLDRPQHKFLTDLILNKLEYDVNSVFFGIELKELFEVLKESKYKDDSQLISYSVNATEITYIYHLISKHKVKGLTKDAYLFAEILMKIGNISKVINYYDATGKNLSADINDWVVTFEDGVSREIREEESVSGVAL